MSNPSTKGANPRSSDVHWDAGHDLAFMFGYEEFTVASTVDMEIVRRKLTFGFEEWIRNQR
jgi:hypothetical protein